MSKSKDFYIVCVKKAINEDSKSPDKHIRHLKQVYDVVQNELIKGKLVTYSKLARRLRKPTDEVKLDSGVIVTRARFIQMEIPV